MRQDKYNPQSGIIYNGDARFNFFLDDYCATFMDTDSSEIHLNTPFIFGQTYGYKNIAIYKGENSISFTRRQRLNTSAYIIAVENALATDWNGFDYIEFRGGILNNLFSCHALESEHKDDGSIQINLYDDTEHYKFALGDCECEFVIGSAANESFGLTGISITNNEAILLLKFNNSQPLNSAFDYICKVKEMLSIMAFRKNIDFDEIYLHHDNRNLSKMQVFLKSDVQTTKKDIVHNITFPELGEGISKLASIIFNSKDKEVAFEIGFIPNSDKDIHWISNDKVRLICSALECELSFIDDICASEEEHLQELILAVKQQVKTHRNGPDKLSAKTYDLIFSNIRTWSMSAGDKICQLYHRYEKEILAISHRMRDSIDITNDDILEFIKYRNSITHGAYRVLEQKIANTAFMLQGLVYCCILKRLGMSEDAILNLCQNGKILS